jgi:hypothetical protein
VPLLSITKSLITRPGFEPGPPRWLVTISIYVIGRTIYLSIYGSTALVDIGRLSFQFPNLYTVGMAPWTSDQSVARPLPTYITAQTQNKRTQKSMPRVGFETTIPVSSAGTTLPLLICYAVIMRPRVSAVQCSTTLHDEFIPNLPFNFTSRRICSSSFGRGRGSAGNSIIIFQLKWSKIHHCLSYLPCNRL